MDTDTDLLTDGGESLDESHRLQAVEEIVVDPDEVIDAMRQNNRDQAEQRTHVFRITPPFNGDHRAEPYVSHDYRHYPPEMAVTPIHFMPAVFVIGHSAGSRHPEWESYLSHPNENVSKSRFREHYGFYDGHGEPEPIEGHADREGLWTEWWTNEEEMWESEVRHALKQTDEIVFEPTYPNFDAGPTTVDLRLEATDEDENTTDTDQ